MVAILPIARPLAGTVGKEIHVKIPMIPLNRTGSNYVPDGRSHGEANAASIRQAEAAANAQEARHDSERMDSDYGSGSDSYSRDDGRLVVSPAEPTADRINAAMGASDHRGLLQPSTVSFPQDPHDQSDATHERHDDA
jgi:hypothetical protein